eukprot:938067-Heterocapsa_arctica.AAC.1
MGRANWVAKVYLCSVCLPKLPALMPGLPGRSWDLARTAYIQGCLLNGATMALGPHTLAVCKGKQPCRTLQNPNRKS